MRKSGQGLNRVRPLFLLGWQPCGAEPHFFSGRGKRTAAAGEFYGRVKCQGGQGVQKLKPRRRGRTLGLMLCCCLLLVPGAGATATPGSWGLDEIHGAQGWALLAGAALTPVTVAVVDTGVDGSHPLLADWVWPGRSVVEGSDPQVWRDDSPEGHGTHVAGIIRAVAGPGPVHILPVKALEADGSGSAADLAAAIRWAAAWRGPQGERVRVINLSLGLRLPEPDQALREAVKAALASGILLVAAAGNESRTVGGYYPAALQGVISVGSIGPDGEAAPDSNSGALTAAPGVGIESTVPGGGTALRSGTSFAAPFVSGVAALLWAYGPERSRAEVVDALLGGELQLDAALNRLTALHAPNLSPPATPTGSPEISLSGTAAPGALVRVEAVRRGTFEPPVEAGTATAGPDGRFSLRIALPVGEGLYSLAATAELGGERSTASQAVTVQVDTTPPPPPWGLKAEPAGWGRALLSWGTSPGPDVAGYLVEREGGLPEYTRTLNVTATDLRPGNRYRFRVMAVDLAGNRSSAVEADVLIPLLNLYLL